MADRRRHNRVEEPAHGRTTGPVYYLGPDDQWVLGELTVNEQWLTFDGTTENVSHSMPHIICVNALDFFNYFESYCFELVYIQPAAAATLGADSKGHRSRAPSRQQIILSSQSNINSFAGLSDAIMGPGRRDGQSPGTSMVEQFSSPGRAERDRGAEYKGPETGNALLSPNGHSHMSPNNNNSSAISVFPSSPGDGGGIGIAGTLVGNSGVPLLPLANLTTSNANGRQSPVNSTTAVRNGGDSFSVTPVLSPATSFQDGVKGFFAAGGGNFEHTVTPPQPFNVTTSSSNPALNSNNAIATPTVVSYPSFQIPNNVPSERIVFKALSMSDYLSWLSVFDQYMDLAVLNKCGIIIPNVAVEPSDEFGHLYKSFAAYGERLPDPNPMLLSEEIGLNF